MVYRSGFIVCICVCFLLCNDVIGLDTSNSLRSIGQHKHKTQQLNSSLIPQTCRLCSQHTFSIAFWSSQSDHCIGVLHVATCTVHVHVATTHVEYMYMYIVATLYNRNWQILVNNGKLKLHAYLDYKNTSCSMHVAVDSWLNYYKGPAQSWRSSDHVIYVSYSCMFIFVE